MSGAAQKKPSKNSIRVPIREHPFAESVPIREHTSPEGEPKKRHARIPREVGTDKRLSGTDIKVYFALSSFTRLGPLVSAGVRWIAECVHLRRTTVTRSLRRLVECGHVEPMELRRGVRARYKLASQIFESATATSATGAQVVNTPEKLRLACAKCRRVTKGLASMGWCRSCVRDTKLEQQVAEAMRELGAQATMEQIFQYVHFRGPKKRIQAILRKLAKR